jgi:peptidase S46-like protein
MKKLTTIVILTLMCLGLAAHADEGMWRPEQLPGIKDKLKALGMESDPAGLADLLKHPMNAVISLGGCTASFVSPEGLVITNHHCAYGSIQHNSTESNNLLKNGFLAKTKAEELPASPGSRVLVTVAVTDVSEEVTGAVPAGAGGLARYEAMENKIKQLVAKCEEDEGHRCRVSSYYGGIEHELIKQLEIRDVRLVHAPAASIGKYGGDIDNWMWPRHTGDYSFYRAYVGPDGQPADFAKENVPFRPKHHLKVTAAGVEAGDFIMAAGYPGSTNRYRLAAEVENVVEWYYPTLKQAYNEWIEIIEKETANRPEAKIKYASMIASLNNAAKNYDGMLNGFGKSDIIERKQLLEKDLQQWIQSDPDRKARYQSTMDDLRKLVAESNENRPKDIFYGYLGSRSSLLSAAKTLYRLSKEKEKPDMEREPGYQERDLIRTKQRLQRITRTFAPEVDQALWQHFIERYAKLPPELHERAFDEWFSIKGSTVNTAKLRKRLDSMYAKTELGKEAKRLAWLDASPADFERSADPFIQLAVKLYASDMETEEHEKDLAGRLKEVRPQHMRVLMAYYDSQGKPLYPDANSTLRVTYGSVRGYSPADGAFNVPFTTLRGITQKDTGKDPFDSPARQLELIKNRDFGDYYVKDLDSVPVNFLTTLDSTGGNSGSATMNGKGELVGLLFDGNWESIIADWDFIPPITRTIHVDMRYVLWIMDKVAGADNLIKEMGL